MARAMVWSRPRSLTSSASTGAARGRSHKRPFVGPYRLGDQTGSAHTGPDQDTGHRGQNLTGWLPRRSGSEDPKSKAMSTRSIAVDLLPVGREHVPRRTKRLDPFATHLARCLVLTEVVQGVSGVGDLPGPVGAHRRAEQ